MDIVIGDPQAPEYSAATHIERLILSQSGLRGVRRATARVIVGARCHGQETSDVDLVLLLHSPSPLAVTLGDAATGQTPGRVHVESLCVAVEVKDHPPDRVRFTPNGDVEVLYGEHWHHASSQSARQRYSLLDHIRAHVGGHPPFVTNILWLRGLTDADLPSGPHNIVASDMSWARLIAAIMSQQRPTFEKGFHMLRAAREPGVLRAVDRLFTRKLRPSALDRRKLEAVAASEARTVIAKTSLGDGQTVYRGRGGTGKTVTMLHLAYSRYMELNQRTLLLTYNRALAADIERLLVILEVRDRVGERSIRVRTIHAFLREVMAAIGLLREETEYLGHYASYKRELAEYLSDPDMRLAVLEDIGRLDWDLVCVDEGQDWEEDERDLLHLLFDHGRCVIADGIDQMVRGVDPCDWTRAPHVRSSTTTHALRVSMRMRANLCRYANDVARALGLHDWEVRPNPRMPGGRVLLTADPSFPSKDLLARIMADDRAAGCDPIDGLYCVPHTLMDRTEDPAVCIPVREFTDCGRAVWNGTDIARRATPALDNSMHRFVLYESCRGLEGWSVFLYGLDTFHRMKLDQCQREGVRTEIGRLRAAEWLLIPLTRCIDTLVIHLDDVESNTARMLLNVARGHLDFCEISDGA